ncbi:hypothetical protein Salat_0187500 [Sesamum alatum]|uniref:Uncharacterized protein n=1 Tax=Sesamum alatum TaxID=300844 RepID=A0AAE2CXR4_9LAMI|nr:hypothetical protein Salat_0187500 [Sesamum alatum]
MTEGNAHIPPLGKHDLHKMPFVAKIGLKQNEAKGKSFVQDHEYELFDKMPERTGKNYFCQLNYYNAQCENATCSGGSNSPVATVDLALDMKEDCGARVAMKAPLNPVCC